MRLENFKIEDDYVFRLDFEDGVSKSVNLYELIKDKVSKEDLKTAHIDKDWGLFRI